MARDAIQRQIKLPLSKAVEIAWKSIRLRLSRSLVVTSSIALAIAFLLSILAGEAFVDSMRDWKRQFESSPRYEQLVGERRALEERARSAEGELRAALHSTANATTRPSASAPPIDFPRQYGGTIDELKSRFRGLPAPAAELTKSLPGNPGAAAAFGRWVEASGRLAAVRDELAAPELLDAKLKSAGVATGAAEIADARAQTRWVIGLALLVAFVGILNAMLMSVTERFREIGTMKCLGAVDGFIVKLFLLESLFQGGAGTVAGVVIGLILSVASAAYSYGAFAWVDVPWVSLFIAAAACFVVGLVLTVGGALYPAWQAARMQPIAAMRVEV